MGNDAKSFLRSCCFMNLYPLFAGMSELIENKPMLMLVMTICGMLVVFVALILLIVIIGLFGNVASIGTKKPKDKSAKKADKPAAPAAAAPVAAAPAMSTAGVPDEIIAVIAAAVASLEDGHAYAIRSVRRSQEGRPAWSMAGLMENTRPF